MMKACNAQPRTWNIQDFKKSFGEEYPAAIVQDGIRMPLRRESRFSRCYHSEELKVSSILSRFMDGSASITIAELQREWPNWTEQLQMDFCQSYYLFPDPDILRFIMEQGEPQHWSAIANLVASELPREEAFKLLVRALQSTKIGEASNVHQGIAATKHPDAEATLRRHFAAVWKHPVLWDNADFNNWVAFDATTCIAHLIKLGSPPADFVEQVRQLSKHICSRNRNSCRNFLSKHYPEIGFQN